MQEEKARGNLLVGYGASGRTNTIAAVLKSPTFDVIVDDSDEKIGSYTPYYHVEIQKPMDVLYDQAKNGDVIGAGCKICFILAWPY